MLLKTQFPLSSSPHRNTNLTVSWMRRVRKKPLSTAVAGGCVTSTCPLAPGSPNALADFLLCMRSSSSWLSCCPTLTWNYWTLLSESHLLTSPVLVWESSSLFMMWTSGTSWNWTTSLCLCHTVIKVHIVHSVYLTVLMKMPCCICK